MRKQKLLWKIRRGTRNVDFKDMVSLVEAYGFRLSRVKGSHHIFAHQDIPELINIQEASGKAKPYQVRQFLAVIDRYGLELEQERK